jgi:nitrite reductase/ring-hydroxylating ferredoxin subunit
MPRHRHCDSDRQPGESRRPAQRRSGGRARNEVGIFNLDGAFYALKNSCPHQAARVCVLGASSVRHCHRTSTSSVMDMKDAFCSVRGTPGSTTSRQVNRCSIRRSKLSATLSAADGLRSFIMAGEAGFEDEALALARRLFAHFDEAIDSLTLVPPHERRVRPGAERLRHPLARSIRARAVPERRRRPTATEQAKTRAPVPNATPRG